ncbi:RDD family protein [Aggregatimonas sangjinii]|uniref:RDD family protein n=1 Tax=Aggregatimonas sangjinii TaxID=2583587 RepID=A0A5B7STV1_9FLAO|nr:RDD family protein [Aggregatimonas sangjinii]QCX00144.1 RDD family protein [Aggregatimonas sangjinii]
MQYHFANLPDRVKAAIIDSIILIVMMYGATQFLNMFSNVTNTVRMLIFILVFLLYDPLLISLFGGTIGHSKAGIIVKREADTSKNLALPSAILRFVIKISLGWISLLTVTGNKKRKALHDIAVGSLVLKDEVKRY